MDYIQWTMKIITCISIHQMKMEIAAKVGHGSTVALEMQRGSSSSFHGDYQKLLDCLS